MSPLERLGIHPARLLWVVLALTAAGPVGSALESRSTAVTAVVLVVLWAGWAVALGALLVPRSSALTVVRILVPAGPVAVGVAVSESGAHGTGILSVAIAAAAAVWVLTPWVGEFFVDGSSYGNEERFPLRAPVLFAFLIAPITWSFVVVGAVAGPLLLASGVWLAGVPLTAVGWAVAAAGARSLHQLSRRWIVLVPTGLVVHDHLTMPEPQLFLRRTISGFGPAPVDADGDGARDLTAGAPGIALRLTVSEPVELLLRSGWRDSRTESADAVLIAPSRPGHVLEAAGRRRIPVG